MVKAAHMPGMRRRRSLGRTVAALFAVVFALAALAAGGALFAKWQYEVAGPLEADKSIIVERGTGTSAIADLLEDEQVITDARFFLLAVLATDSAGKLKAGEYLIPARASLRQVRDLLVEGRTVVHSVTVPEGLTSLQVVQRLRDQPLLTGEIDTVPPEGSILPETYRFQRGEDRAQVLQRMQEAQAELVERLWPERTIQSPINSLQDALILASIVEKETGVAEERAKIAGVFINRLRRGMRLQSDPTIIYGIVGGEGRLDRPIRRSDINQRTEYNTYQIDGLPPTPIANPGKASIQAVLNPEETDALYFVADGTGGHAFARTLAEHNRNVRRWREIEREREAALRENERRREEAAREQIEEETEAADVVEEPDVPGRAGDQDVTFVESDGPDAAARPNVTPIDVAAEETATGEPVAEEVVTEQAASEEPEGTQERQTAGGAQAAEADTTPVLRPRPKPLALAQQMARQSAQLAEGEPMTITPSPGEADDGAPAELQDGAERPSARPIRPFVPSIGR